MFRNRFAPFAAVAVAILAVLAVPELAMADPGAALAASTASVLGMASLGVLGYTVQQLRERRATIVTHMREMLTAAESEQRDLSDKEQENYSALEAAVGRIGAGIDRQSKLESLESDLERHSDSAALRAAAARSPGATASGPKKQFESLAEFVATCAFNPNDQRLANLYHERRGDMEMGTGSAGGFAVPTQFRAELMEVAPQGAIVRPRATVIPAGSPPDSAISMPALNQEGANANNVYGGVTVNWTAEGGTKPKSDVKLREITLQPHEVSGYITLSDKLLRNWGAGASLVERQLRAAVVAAEDTEFLRGNGVGKPLGAILSGAAKTVNRNEASKIKIVDVDAMVAVMKMGGSPIWTASQSVLPQLQALVDGDGRRLWSAHAADGYPGTLAGYPVMWNERSPLLGALGDLALLDLSYYLIKDGSGPFVEAGKATGDFETNKTSIKITWNVDGQPWLTEPFKQEGGFIVSPFVVLDVPSGG